MKLSEVAAEQKVLAVPIAGDALKITYRPNGFTIARSEELADLAAEAEGSGNTEQVREFVAGVLEMLIGWDLVDDTTPEGDIVPLTLDAVALKVPVGVLRRIMQAIQADSAPEAQGSSAAGSRRTGR